MGWNSRAAVGARLPRAGRGARRLSFKYLRKTGGNLVRRLGGSEQSEVYLAHADPKMARPYTNKDFAALGRTLIWLRRQLIPVLGPLAQPEDQCGEGDVSAVLIPRGACPESP